MNNTFNTKRFIMLFKKHTLEHAKTYLLSTAVLAGLLFLLLGYYSYSAKGHLNTSLQTMTFAIFMLLGGSIFTSLSFAELGDKKKSISVLTLPASHFEKYLVSWLYSYVIFQLVFIGVFYLIDNIIISTGAPAIDDAFKVVDIFTIDRMSRVFEIYAFFHGLTIWGAIFFEKLHFIKTAFVFFICLILLVFLNNGLLNVFIGKDMEGVPFQGMGYTDGRHWWRILPADTMINCGWYVLALVVLLLWTSAFSRLKEKEV